MALSDLVVTEILGQCSWLFDIVR